MKRYGTIALLMLVPALLWIACWPFVDSAVNDDFSYAFTVKQLLDTGELKYNGWSSPIVGSQAIWGALFAKVFGFSHDVLRFSILPISMACSVLAYALHRRIGITRPLSLFATLLLVTSPLFTSWSVSFMTDIPGLLMTLLLFHCVIGGMTQRTLRGALFWGCAAVLVSLFGGAIRQSLLVLGAAAMFMLIVRNRKHRGPMAALVLISLLYLVCGYGLIAWHQSQLFTLREPWPVWDDIPTGGLLLLGLFLQFGFFLLPLAPVWIRGARLHVFLLTGSAVVMIGLAFGIHSLAPDSFAARLAQGLWVGDTLTHTGMLRSDIDAPGQRPAVFNNPARLLIGAAVFWQILLVAGVVWKERKWLRDRIVRFRNEPCPDSTWIFAALAAIALAYLALIAPRAAMRMAFDRYLLVILPIVTLATLRYAQQRWNVRAVSPWAWTTCAAFALLGVGTTFDHFAELRARQRFAADLVRDGVKRTDICNGLAYDGWTQLLATGHVNNPHIALPEHIVIYSPVLGRRAERYWFLRYVPDVEPRQMIVNWPTKPDATAGKRSQSFRTLLPPFERWLVVLSADENDPE